MNVVRWVLFAVVCLFFTSVPSLACELYIEPSEDSLLLEELSQEQDAVSNSEKLISELFSPQSTESSSHSLVEDYTGTLEARDDYSDHAVDKLANMPVDKVVEEPLENPLEKVFEEPLEKPIEKELEEWVENPIEKEYEERVEKPVEKEYEERVEKPVEKEYEERVESPIEKENDERVERPVEEEKDERVERPVEEEKDERLDEVAEKMEEESEDYLELVDSAVREMEKESVDGLTGEKSDKHDPLFKDDEELVSSGEYPPGTEKEILDGLSTPVDSVLHEIDEDLWSPDREIPRNVQEEVAGGTAGGSEPRGEVPEPATLILLASGLFGAARYRRKVQGE